MFAGKFNDKLNRSIGHAPRLGPVIGVACVCLLVISGCSGSDDTSAADTDSSSRSTTSVSTTTTADQTTTTGLSTDPTTTLPSGETPAAEVSAEAQEIIDRYVGYWDARFDANSGTPNPDAEELREYATGEQLLTVVSETQDNLADGLSFRRAAKPAAIRDVRVASNDGNVAVVQECFVDDDVVVNTSSGEVVSDEISTQNVRGQMQRIDGTWRLARAELVQTWEGVAGCALDT